MRAVTYSDVRKDLARTLDHVVDDAEEVVVTRSGREAVVIIPLREYESLKETAYLMSSPANARHLHEAINELRNGGGEPHDLINSGEAEPAGNGYQPEVAPGAARTGANVRDSVQDGAARPSPAAEMRLSQAAG